MSRGPVARSLEELDDLERQNLEAGTMGEAYSPPSNTMEAINRVAIPPEDARKAFDEGIPAHEGTTKGEDASVPVAAVHDAAKAKKSQREMLADWLKDQDAMLRGMTSERERAISGAERASAGSDQGRSIINSLAAGGSILAGNKDLARGYMAQAGEMPGQQKAESDRKALAAWVAKQAEGLDSRGKLMQQAGEADERNAYLRDALATRPPPKEPGVDPLADLKGQKLKAEIDKLKRPPVQKAEKPAVDWTKDPELALPEFELTGEVKPSKVEVAKLRDAQGSTRTLKGSVERLKKLIGDYGIETMPGEAKSQILSELRDLQLNMKGPAMYQLGVIAGPDMDLLNAVTGNPTEATVNNMLTGGGGELKRLIAIGERANAKMQAEASARGYRPKGGGISAPTGGQPKEGDMMKTNAGTFKRVGGVWEKQ